MDVLIAQLFINTPCGSRASAWMHLTDGGYRHAGIAPLA
jgi:hypothetical protein